MFEYLSRRTSPTLPGALLRFPNLGLPLLPPPSSGGNERSDDKTSTSGGGKAWRETEVTAAEHAKGSRESTSSSATGRKGAAGGRAEGAAFGDLVVQASVTLPGGECSAFLNHAITSGYGRWWVDNAGGGKAGGGAARRDCTTASILRRKRRFCFRKPWEIPHMWDRGFVENGFCKLHVVLWLRVVRFMWRQAPVSFHQLSQDQCFPEY